MSAETKESVAPEQHKLSEGLFELLAPPVAECDALLRATVDRQADIAKELSLIAATLDETDSLCDSLVDLGPFLARIEALGPRAQALHQRVQVVESRLQRIHKMALKKRPKLARLAESAGRPGAEQEIFDVLERPIESEEDEEASAQASIDESVVDESASASDSKSQHDSEPPAETTNAAVETPTSAETTRPGHGDN
ncbi:MAG: hypothetical protein MHM6MM_000346 [Cercozoa sp. M6MM]